MADYSSAIGHRPCTDAGLPIPANAGLGNSQANPPYPTRPVPDTNVPLIEVSEASFSKLRFYVKREDIGVRVIESTKKRVWTKKNAQEHAQIQAWSPLQAGTQCPRHVTLALATPM